MALNAKELYQAGNLADAISAMNDEVRSNPVDQGRRGFLAELLCFSGNLERADKLLDVISTQDPDVAVGVAMIRQLIRADRARRELFSAGRVPEFLEKPSESLSKHLEAVTLFRQGDAASAAKLLEEAEAARSNLSGSSNDKPFDDFRDLDDPTASFFEVLTSTGKYFWVEMSRVREMEFHAPERPMDLIWRRASVDVVEGPDGDVFIPAIYVPPADALEEGQEVDDQALLGRSSDWIGEEGSPARGVGQRCFLVGDDLVPIMQLESLQFNVEA
ncbi:type VI secretion system accessory protein TagJ [Pelagibius sp. Alg239-R121]|uniref:type VI secretion system accessory protein TagJ n=1 Tax=Pelagibius sp. Alg239-R121 TaxID=2993448 RepID=UPI0024A6B2AC|nr:type VI secretion system accessory protein TagJ [Pelagibius sp. Alg239-R121]